MLRGIGSSHMKSTRVIAYLGIVKIKSVEILQGDSLLLCLLGYEKSGFISFISDEYKPKSPEPLISGDLGNVAVKSAEILQRGSPLGCLGLCKSWNRSVSYPTEIRARIAGTTDKRRPWCCRNQRRRNFAWGSVIRVSRITQKLESISFVSDSNTSPNHRNH